MAKRINLPAKTQRGLVDAAMWALDWMETTVPISYRNKKLVHKLDKLVYSIDWRFGGMGGLGASRG